MINIIIISAGNFGREVYTWMNQAIACGEEWRIKGFLDDRTDILMHHAYDVPVLSSVADYEPCKNDLFICAIGDVKKKKKYCEIIYKKGGGFATLIHPTAIIGPNVRIGEGSIIGPLTQLSCEIELGKQVSVGPFSGVAHDVRIGDYVQMSSHCALNGNVAIGSEVFLGCGAIVIPGITIGDGAFIGAGSVVIRKVEPGYKVFGNPARIIGRVEE
jgi:sugar O-acyltransferase (sialic acid O-acetyltransferase NeuD family)